jgi:hypothetical protein
MDSLDELTKKSSKGFFKHVFNFDEDSKNDLLNILQYSILAIIPIVILNKLIQKYVPEADEDKGSLEISAEVIVQIMVMFIGLFFINRIVFYVPTYSGSNYPEFNVTGIVLAVLIIVLGLQTKLGEKISILVDRVVMLYEGDDGDRKKKANKARNNNVRVTQPIVTPGINNNPNYDMNTTSISSLPTISNASPNQPSSGYDQMSSSSSSMMGSFGNNVSANGYEGFQNGPMAANDALGGSFGSAFGSGW